MGYIYIFFGVKFTDSVTPDDILDGRVEYEPYLVIDYCEDLKKKFEELDDVLPDYDVLYTIKNAVPGDKDLIYNYFKDFYRPGSDRGRDWFVPDDKIYDFFDTNTTITDIRKAIEKG